MIAANRLDEAFKDSDALADPAQFLGTDLELRRVPGLDVRQAQQLEAAAAEFVLARPGLDERGRDLLALRAQEIEAVGFWRVQAKHEQGAMVEPFSCLVHEERGIAKHTIVHTCMRELQRVRRKRMPVRSEEHTS